MLKNISYKQKHGQIAVLQLRIQQCINDDNLFHVYRAEKISQLLLINFE